VKKWRGFPRHFFVSGGQQFKVLFSVIASEAKQSIFLHVAVWIASLRSQ
jgi:hypothetical protein